MTDLRDNYKNSFVVLDDVSHECDGDYLSTAAWKIGCPLDKALSVVSSSVGQSIVYTCAETYNAAKR